MSASQASRPRASKTSTVPEDCDLTEVMYMAVDEPARKEKVERHTQQQYKQQQQLQENDDDDDDGNYADIRLDSGSDTDFSIEDEEDGKPSKPLSLVHRKADGTLETWSCKAQTEKMKMWRKNRMQQLQKAMEDSGIMDSKAIKILEAARLKDPKCNHVCEYCSKTFRLRRDYDNHLRVHTGERPFKCSVCGNAFKLKSGLREHTLIHLDEKPHKCTHCDKCFRSARTLSNHVRTHTGDKPYSCEKCSKKFAQSGQLKTHMKTHTGEKPYACTFAGCGLRFALRKTLVYHESTHTGVKRFECQYCQKRFVRKDQCVSHIKRVHSTWEKEKHTCEKCGQSFTEKSSKMRHIQNKHCKEIKDENYVDVSNKRVKLGQDKMVTMLKVPTDGAVHSKPQVIYCNFSATETKAVNTLLMMGNDWSSENDATRDGGNMRHVARGDMTRGSDAIRDGSNMKCDSTHVVHDNCDTARDNDEKNVSGNMTCPNAKVIQDKDIIHDNANVTHDNANVTPDNASFKHDNANVIHGKGVHLELIEGVKNHQDEVNVEVRVVDLGTESGADNLTVNTEDGVTVPVEGEIIEAEVVEIVSVGDLVYTEMVLEEHTSAQQ